MGMNWWIDTIWINGKAMDIPNGSQSGMTGSDVPGELVVTDVWRLDNEGFSKSNGVIEKGKYRTAYGYLAGVEFYPIKNSNLHFYLTYVGRHYSYTDRAKAFGADDYSTNRISLGYIWQLPMF